MSVILALALLALALIFSPFRSARAQTADLILSEYVDGSISNQAIEIYNGTGAPVNLNNYRLELYSNTNTTPNAAVTLSGSLANDATWVIVSPGAGPQLTARANQLSNVISFNGNDSVVLRRNGVVVDSFGRIGENPPNGWQGGGVRTFEVTLRRKANVCAGRTNPNTPFNPSQEWNQFPQDAFEGLGAHTNSCNVHAPAPLINEFVFNHVGQNTHEYIEIYGQGNANYNAFTVLVVDGRASGDPGQVYRTYPVGMTTPSGYWTTGFLVDQIYNGTTTLLLARNFSSGVGIDLDQNNDGFFDFEPWSDLADSIAVSANQQGDRVYSDVTLYPGFGGNAQMVSGASRIPNATNSGSPNDWRRNHFNGEGLNCANCNGSASGQEAVNTPNFVNRLGAVMPTPTHVYPSVTPFPTTTVYPTVTTGPVTPIPPVPGNCVNLIRNYSFESNSYWIFGQDPVPARYVGEQQHSGLRSLLLGNPPDNGSQNLESFSSVRQLVTVPADGTTAYLRWWHIHHTQEGVTDSPGRQEDRQDVILLAQNMQPMEISSRVRQNNGVWQESQVDLTNYIGKTFYIYFNAYNDGNGQRTWQYLDDIQMLVCYPDGYTPVPATPVPPVQPTAPVYPTAPIYPTAYPTACTVSTPCPTPTNVDGVEIITPSPVASVTGTEIVIGGTSSPSATPASVDALPPAVINQPTPADPNAPSTDSNATDDVDLWPTAAPAATDTPSAPVSTPIPPTAEQPAATPLPEGEISDDIPDDNAETPTTSTETVTAPPATATAKGTAEGTDEVNSNGVAECVADLVINPGFEKTDEGWRLVANDGQVIYAGEIVAGGKQSMRIGVTSTTDQPYESFITQSIELPDAYGSILLTYNYYPMTNATDATADIQAVDVYNDLTGQLARRVMHVQRNDRDWLYAEDELSSLAGQKIQLRFSVIDSGGNSTAMYVDNVRIKVCEPLPPRTETDGTQNNGGESNGDDGSSANRRWFFGSRVSDASATPQPTSSSGSSSNGFFDSIGSVAVMLGILLIIAIVIWALFFRPRRKSP